MHITTKRVYEEPSADDGTRVLIDRLWPRGLTKEKAAIDLWIKEVAPSPELRELFHEEKIDFRTFARRYEAELAGDDKAEAIDSLLAQIDHRKHLTLLYGLHDTVNNNAAVLKKILEKKT